MYFTRLDIHSVRNLQKTSFSPHPHFNILLGKNGSGKTSLLEAIYLLGLGRSFRAHKIDHVIAHHDQALACYAELQAGEDSHKITVGIEKNRFGALSCKINGTVYEKLSLFAKNIPLQLITPESFRLLQAGPEERRKFLDWGVFHVEPLFAQLCQRFARLLKQRNASLKYPQGASFAGFEYELAEAGEKISIFRRAYISQLVDFFGRVREYLLPGLAIQFNYQQGWPEGVSLGAALQASYAQDQRRGFTQVGPQRAELALSVAGVPAQHILSRGQQKLLLSALFVAQGQQLRAQENKKCVYLIDDLASELDKDNRSRLLSLIAQEAHQVFLTGVDASGWEGAPEVCSGEMFHVEQGELKKNLPLLSI